LKILKWNLFIVVILVLTGCSTTNIDWEEACTIDTPKAYHAYLQKHPDSPYAEQAELKMEKFFYDSAKGSGTVAGYSSYLVKRPNGTHAKEIRAKIKEMRCQDTSLTKAFPTWLKKGQASDPKRHGSWFLDDSYIGISPSDIGRGYKAAGDDPEYPLELEWGAGHLIYFAGRGVIIGPDGTNVLVGYTCK
jgi:hypothetical protein